MPGPGHTLTRPRPGPNSAARGMLDAYLASLAADLHGPARLRRAILTELRDGLQEAAGAHQAGGLPPTQAASAATEDFGDPHALAASFAPELAAARARRVALTLGGTGPLVGAAWLAAMAASGNGEAALLRLWHHDLAGVLLALPLVAAAITTAGLAVAVAVAATSRLSRWAVHPPRLAAGAAATAGIAAVAVDLTLLGMLAAQTLTAPASLTWPLVALAAAVSSIRLLLAGRAARRCLTLRATLAHPR